VAAKREPHVPTSEIHSQAHASHALVSRWLMEIPLASAEAEDNKEHGGNAHVEQELTEENRSENLGKFSKKHGEEKEQRERSLERQKNQT